LDLKNHENKKDKFFLGFGLRDMKLGNFSYNKNVWRQDPRFV
jgi:hypothetical protein